MFIFIFNPWADGPVAIGKYKIELDNLSSNAGNEHKLLHKKFILENMQCTKKERKKITSTSLAGFCH